jgi:hypothetical protein
MLANNAKEKLGIIYDYAGWHDPGCSTLPRLRSDLATLNELQILVPRLNRDQVYKFAEIKIIHYIYNGIQGCSYKKFFEHTFPMPIPNLSVSETSVESIKTRAKSLIQTYTNANEITSYLTIKTFGDLNQCIIFGHYYGNQGFYKNNDTNHLPIFMTGDAICGYMSALISNQVITEKHNKSNTLRKDTRELVDGVIYYLNCNEKDKHKQILTQLSAKTIRDVNDYLDEIIEDDPGFKKQLSEIFGFICPHDPTEEDAIKTLEELVREIPDLNEDYLRDEHQMEIERQELDIGELLDITDSDKTFDPNRPPKKRIKRTMPAADAIDEEESTDAVMVEAERGQGKQTYKNRAKKATGTKKATRAKKVTRTKKAKKNLKKTKNIKRR